MLILDLRALDFSGTQAAGANGDGLVSSVDDSSDLPDVRLPRAVCSAVRVGYVLSEYNALSANTALCHLYAPPFDSFRNQQALLYHIVFTIASVFLIFSFF